VYAKTSHGMKYIKELLAVNVLGFMVKLILRFRINLVKDGRAIRESKNLNKIHADFRKYDGTLKMVLNISTKNREELLAYLEGEKKNGNLFYGIHVSNRALMTCLINFKGVGEVHFVDAADGGYALAARMLKEQLN
jgi:hypothetical protein